MDPRKIFGTRSLGDVLSMRCSKLALNLAIHKDIFVLDKAVLGLNYMPWLLMLGI
jgi:hypothetical protein